MALRWDFWRRRSASPARREADAIAARHLDEFVRTRRGVEAFLEPATTMSRASLLLVAYDGEWTRRSVESHGWSRRFAAGHSLPVYDAGVIGYPQRMRDFNARRKDR